MSTPQTQLQIVCYLEGLFNHIIIQEYMSVYKFLMNIPSNKNANIQLENKGIYVQMCLFFPHKKM